MQRVWGVGDYIDADAPRASWRAWAARDGVESIPVERTIVRWFEDGFRLPMEQGSAGWPGFFATSASGYVTHVNSVVAGLQQHWTAIRTAANAQRGAKMRAARASQGFTLVDYPPRGVPGSWNL